MFLFSKEEIFKREAIKGFIFVIFLLYINTLMAELILKSNITWMVESNSIQSSTFKMHWNKNRCRVVVYKRSCTYSFQYCDNIHIFLNSFEKFFSTFNSTEHTKINSSFYENDSLNQHHQYTNQPSSSSNKSMQWKNTERA